MNRRVACATGAAAVAVGVLLAAGPAWAGSSTEVVQGEVLRLVSVADWGAASSLLPGRPVQWDVTVSAEAADPGVVEVGVSANGDAALVTDVLRCGQAWEESGCPGGQTMLESGWSIPRDGSEVELLEMADTEVAHLRFIISLSGDDAGSTQVWLHARGAGESAAIGPDGGLATTGLSPLAPWTIGAGIGIGAVGTLLIAAARRRAVVERAGGS